MVASYLAAKYPSIAGLIVESPVSRISAVAGVFSCLLTKKQRENLRGLDCVDYLQNVICPKLLIYGSLDHFNRRNSQRVEIGSAAHLGISESVLPHRYRPASGGIWA